MIMPSNCTGCHSATLNCETGRHNGSILHFQLIKKGNKNYTAARSCRICEYSAYYSKENKSDIIKNDLNAVWCVKYKKQPKDN